jgi:hypothetical protein
MIEITEIGHLRKFFLIEPIFCRQRFYEKPGPTTNSDMQKRIYPAASIAENAVLPALHFGEMIGRPAGMTQSGRYRDQTLSKPRNALAA